MIGSVFTPLIGKMACYAGFAAAASYVYTQLSGESLAIGLIPGATASPSPTPDAAAIRACLTQIESHCDDSTIRKIAHAVGGIEAFCNLPALPWQKRFLEGRTALINGVRPGDLSAPMMRGVDGYGRPFLAVRTETDDGYSKTLGVETIFQKYSKNEEPWESGNGHDRNPIVYSTVDEEALEKLEQLAMGGTIRMTKSYSDEVVHKKLA